jgi:ferredoxin
MTIRLSDGCTACGACLITCPTGALTAAPFRPAVNAGRCTDCLACVEVCPADAIVLVPAGTPGISLPSPARIRP